MNWTRRRYAAQRGARPTGPSRPRRRTQPTARRSGELDDDATRRGLAASRLAHQAQYLTAPERKVDPVHGADVPTRAPPASMRPPGNDLQGPGFGKWSCEAALSRSRSSSSPPSRPARARADPPVGTTAPRGTAGRRRLGGGGYRWQATRTPSVNRDLGRDLLRQTSIARRTARMEAAPGRRRSKVGRRARDRAQVAPTRLDVSGTLAAALRVRVARRAERRSDRPLLGDPTRVHDQHPVARLGNAPTGHA